MFFVLNQESTNYSLQVKSNLPLVFVNKMFLENNHTHPFKQCMAAFALEQHSRVTNRHCKAHTALAFYYLALCRKKLPTPVFSHLSSTGMVCYAATDNEILLYFFLSLPINTTEEVFLYLSMKYSVFIL